MRISADLGSLWQDVPLIDRVYLAADNRFDGVDIPDPYDLPAKELQRALLATGLSLVSIVAPPPNYTGGARGFAAWPGAEQRFRHDLRRSLRYADALGAPLVRLLTGPDAEEIRSQANAMLDANLRWAVAQPGKAGLLLSAAPETALRDPGTAADLVQAIGHDRLRLRVSLRAGRAAILPNLSQTGMIVATEKPDTGDQGLADLLRAVETAGFNGWLSAAYPQAAKEADVPTWYHAGFQKVAKRA